MELPKLTYFPKTKLKEELNAPSPMQGIHMNEEGQFDSGELERHVPSEVTTPRLQAAATWASAPPVPDLPVSLER